MVKKYKDPNYVAKLEKAISEKYGEETITNPRGSWNDEKEAIYQEQIQKLYKKQDSLDEMNEKIEVNGVLIPKKLLTREDVNRTCPACKTYSFNLKDDIYMKKFDCCYNCYIQWVEGREERWKSGWRPEQAGDK
tara:strand:- start:129 stop:530 length:402 start_codon:yes stop_codon:yes gene_type:complete